ncbi:MAG: alpha/beta hydrolase [Rhodospirillales bacterium]|nr:alpha/beta hydrolase [Rhodospirillales bacterium]
MMYFPWSDVPVPAESGVPEMRPIEVTTTDGFSLTSWYYPPPPGQPTVVFFHGNAGHIGHRGYKARVFLDAGLGFALVGYRGFGGNPGRPTEAGLYADGSAVLAFLAAAGVPPARIALYGESLGSGVAVHLAHEAARNGTPVGAVILEAPFSSVAAAAQHHYPYLPAYWLVKDRFASIDKIADIRAPLLVIHGARDQVIPERFGREVFAAAREPKEALWLPQAGHNNVFEHGVAGQVTAFIRRHMGIVP